jgi:serine/threonine protein kinase
MLHDNNIVHYDIKADNILLDFEVNKFGSVSEDMNIVVADFGECHIFSCEEDEYSLKSRGTECNQSPEMLTLTISTKKEADHYDRRKRVGTTRVSDVWSLGCLLFEILTGEHLFHNPDWVQFYIRVTSV